MEKQKLTLLPKTVSGKWSIGLIIAMPILFFIGSSFSDSIYASVPSGDTLLADIAARPALALAMLAGMAAGVAAFITGILAIFRKKDQSILVYVSSLAGALLVVFLAGEFLFPH